MRNFSNVFFETNGVEIDRSFKRLQYQSFFKLVIVNIQKNHRHFIKLESSDRPLPINDILPLDYFDLLSL